MKKIFLALAAFACTAMPMVAQTLSVKVGGVTYQYPAQKVGDMNYMNGKDYLCWIELSCSRMFRR